MSEKELIEYLQQNLENSSMIDTETGIAALKILAGLAEKEQVEWALAGGLAMHLYGSDRLTKDVDVLSSAFLSIDGHHRITFGGISYDVKIGTKSVLVDWIVRNDEYSKYYRAALAEAVALPGGIRIITPEWLVILKSIAGRPKDRDDAVFLLKKKGTVDREKIKEKIIAVDGEEAWRFARLRFRDLYDLADGTVTTEEKYSK